MAMKTTSPLAGLLRKSPFKQIQEHMRTVFSCVLLLPALCDAVYRKDQNDLRDIAEQIKQDDNITWFSVSAENFESLHNHSAYASITSE